MHVPERMGVLLEVLVAVAARGGGEERRQAEGQQQELDDEEGDRGVEGEALGWDCG